MQGTVYRLDRQMAMIWTTENFLVRIKSQAGFSVGAVVSFVPEDLVQPSGQRHFVLSYRQIGFILASALLAVAILLLSLQSLLAGFFLPPAVALVSVDINPSVMLSVSDNGQVVAVKAQNQDARELNLNALRGQDVDAALASIVSQVTEAGIIDPADGVLDYVLVSAVNLDEQTDTFDHLAGILDQAAIRNRTLSAVNLVLNRADMTDLAQAQAQNIPVGLVVLADQLGIGVEGETVQSFFANPAHSAQMLERVSTDGQLLKVKAKVDLPTVALSVNKTDREEANDRGSDNQSTDDIKGETTGKPAADPKNPSETRKSETPAATNPATDRKDETPAATNPATDRKDETPAATNPATDRKDETPAATNPATDKKTDSRDAPGQAKKSQ